MKVAVDTSSCKTFFCFLLYRQGKRDPNGRHHWKFQIKIKRKLIANIPTNFIFSFDQFQWPKGIKIVCKSVSKLSGNVV